MAAMTTATRSRKVSEVRALDATPGEKLARALDIEALSASAALLGAIEQTREARGLSKAELARSVDLQRTAVSRLLEEDEANPTLRTLVRLLWAVGLHAEVSVRGRRPDDDRVLEVSEDS